MIREQKYSVSPESGMYLMYVSVMRESVAASFLYCASTATEQMPHMFHHVVPQFFGSKRLAQRLASASSNVRCQALLHLMSSKECECGFAGPGEIRVVVGMATIASSYTFHLESLRQRMFLAIRVRRGSRGATGGLRLVNKKLRSAVASTP